MIPIIYLFIAVTFMPEHQFFAASFGGLTVAKFCGIFVLVAALLMYPMQPRTGSKCPLRLKLPLLIYTGVLLTSTIFRGGSTLLSDGYFMKCISILATCFITYVMLGTPERFRIGVTAALCSLVIASSYNIKQYIAFHNMYYDFRGWGGVSGDPNYYAAVVVLWLPVTMAAISQFSTLGWASRFFCGAVVLIGFVTAGSRGGLVGLVISGIFLTVTYRRVKPMIVASVVLLPLMLILPNSPLRRLQNPTSGDQGAAESRQVFWRAAWHIFLDNPTVGVGDLRFANELWAQQKIDTGEHVAHNTYLESLGRYGLAGTIPLIWLLIEVFISLGRAARQLRDKGLAHAARAMQAGVVGYAVCIIFITASWQMTTWLMVGATMALARLALIEKNGAENGPTANITAGLSMTVLTPRVGGGSPRAISGADLLPSAAAYAAKWGTRNTLTDRGRSGKPTIFPPRKFR